MLYEKNAFSTPFLSGYKILKIPIIDTCGNPSWPELFPVEKIQQMQETVGPRHFSAQMMLEFISPERARLDPGALHFYDDEFEPRIAKIGEHVITGCVLYWDPSTGRTKRDGSACVLIYRDDKNKRVFIHDILYLSVSDSEQFPLSRQCDMVINFMRLRNLNRITVETNGIGIGIPEIMHDCALRCGYNIYVNRISHTKTKSDRILGAIEPVLSTGRLYAHMRIQKTPLISEMIGWSPIGYIGHDDGLDAVAGAIAHNPTPVRPLGHTIHTFTANTDFKI